MKKIFFFLLLLSPSFAKADTPPTPYHQTPLYTVGYINIYEDGKTVTFTPLTKERLTAIAKLEDHWDTVTKEEIAKLIVQSYPDTYIKTEMTNAYNKLKKYPEYLPTTDQETKFKTLMTQTPNRQTVYDFLMLMTKEQIIAIGY